MLPGRIGSNPGILVTGTLEPPAEVKVEVVVEGRVVWGTDSDDASSLSICPRSFRSSSSTVNTGTDSPFGRDVTADSELPRSSSCSISSSVFAPPWHTRLTVKKPMPQDYTICVAYCVLQALVYTPFLLRKLRHFRNTYMRLSNPLLRITKRYTLTFTVDLVSDLTATMTIYRTSNKPDCDTNLQIYNLTVNRDDVWRPKHILYVGQPQPCTLIFPDYRWLSTN